MQGQFPLFQNRLARQYPFKGDDGRFETCCDPCVLLLRLDCLRLVGSPSERELNTLINHWGGLRTHCTSANLYDCRSFY